MPSAKGPKPAPYSSKKKKPTSMDAVIQVGFDAATGKDKTVIRTAQEPVPNAMDKALQETMRRMWPEVLAGNVPEPDFRLLMRLAIGENAYRIKVGVIAVSGFDATGLPPLTSYLPPFRHDRLLRAGSQEALDDAIRRTVDTFLWHGWALDGVEKGQLPRSSPFSRPFWQRPHFETGMVFYRMDRGTPYPKYIEEVLDGTREV